MKTSILAILGICLGVSLTPLWADAKQTCFHINDPSHRDVVRFTSDAPVELIEGSTHNVKGKVCYDDSFRFDAKHPFDIHFEVDLASLDTGISLRNQHMRDNFLHTDKFPKATYQATAIKAMAKPPFKTTQQIAIQSKGTFTVHGKSIPKTIPLKVTYFQESDTTHNRFRSGDLIRIQGTFPVKLTDHAIERPQAIFVKLADTVMVTVDMFGTSEPAALTPKK